MSPLDILHDTTQLLREDTQGSVDTVVPTTPTQQLPSLLESTPQNPANSHDPASGSKLPVRFSEPDRSAHHHSSDSQHSQPSHSDPEPRPHQEHKFKSHIPLPGNGIATYKSPPNTPSARTGPPRSVSFAYALPASPSLMSAKPSQAYFQQTATEEQLPAETSLLADLEAEYSFKSDKDFRGALEYRDQQERDLRVNTKGKRRQHSDSVNWDINPMKWFHESPKDEKPGIDFLSPPTTSDAAGQEKQSENQPEEEEHDKKRQDSSHSETEGSRTASFFSRRPPKRGTSANDPSGAQSPTDKATNILRRAFSVPPSESQKEPKGKEKENDDTAEFPGGAQMSPTLTSGTVKWAKLRALLPQMVHPTESILPGPSAVTSQAVNITDELITGGLSTLMLRLWMDRDEKCQRRVPVLLHRLRIRVSDSLHPMERHGSVFRIECEYANGAARWVVYRELRDFLSLHAHYTVSNMYNQNVDKMPEFPKTSLPYFKFLKKEIREKGDGTKVDRASFARLQREALENYLIDLIRAVVSFSSSIIVK